MELAEKIAVMRGALKDFNLANILQVISIGRQLTAVELSNDSGTPAGTIFLKSGKVVSAVAAGVHGKEAFFRLFEQPLPFFHVFRAETPVSLPEPLGSVANLLMEAVVRLGEAGRASRPSALPPAFMAPTEASALAPSEGAWRHEPATAPAKERFNPASTSTGASTPVSPPLNRAGLAARPSVRPDPPGAPRIVMAIASPKGGSGKTTMSLNLALSLARQGRSVILVDGDINGDVLSAIDSRDQARHGVFDALVGKVSIEDALLATVLPHFRILPAVGALLPDAAMAMSNRSEAWRVLLGDISAKAEIVLVDTPAGMFGTTHQILSGCTHVIGVLQSEVVAHRSFAMFMHGLEALPADRRPIVLGVFLNMLQVGHSASVAVLSDICAELPKGWLFDTAIPRTTAFLDASEAGIPLRLLDDKSPPAVTWLFDTLATEVTERLKLPVPERRKQRLLV